MQVDYRRYNNPESCCRAVAVTTLLLLARVCDARHERRASVDPAWRAVTLQPSELAKPVMVLFLAYFLQTRIHAMDDWKGTILRAALPPLVFIALILKEPDLGTALVCAAVTCADAVPGGGAVEVLLRSAAAACGAGAVLHAVPCGVPAGADAGVHQPGAGSARARASTSCSR